MLERVCPKCAQEGDKIKHDFYTHSCNSVLCVVDKYNQFGKWCKIE